MPPLSSWVEKMSGTVVFISIVSIFFIANAGVSASKPYIAQLIMFGAASITIIVLRMKQQFLNIVHSLNCTIYMITIIWTYIDQDFYRDPMGDFLTGYIQGLATYVYICGTSCVAKFFLITLLFISMSFCNGTKYFVSHFIQVIPLWLLFLYKVYADERVKRQLFLSEQQEDVYKYIIQNVLPNGLFLLKYDQKVEQVELHSSNQRPHMFSGMRTTDDVKHMLKNTILARDDQQLSSLTGPSSVWSWDDTLDGHLRRKIDQTLSWGEKRFIKLKDKNIIRNRQNSSTTINQSIFESQRVIQIPLSAATAPNSLRESEIELYRTPKNTNIHSEFSPRKKQLRLGSLPPFSVQQIASSRKVTLSTNNRHFPLNPSFLSGFGAGGSALQPNEMASYASNGNQKRETQMMAGRNKVGSLSSNPGNGGGGAVQGSDNMLRRLKQGMATQSQINISEVASNLLASSQIDKQQQQQTYRSGQRKFQTKTSNLAKLSWQEPPANSVVGANAGADGLTSKITDLVETFSGVYKKSEGIDYKLNLRLSTFYLNEIYGVISVEDESFKERYNKKNRSYERLSRFFARSIRDTNNSIVLLLSQITLASLSKESSKPTSSIYGTQMSGNSTTVQLSRNSLIFELLRIKNKIDLHNFAIGLINGVYPQQLCIEECQSFSLLANIQPLIEFCKAKASSLGIRMYVDIGKSLQADDLVFSQKQLMLVLFQSILFNAIEAAPHKGTVAVRINLSSGRNSSNYLKVKVFNTTSRRVDLSLFQRFEDQISLESITEDIRVFDRPLLGLRISHWILQRIGPTNHIKITTDQSMAEGTNQPVNFFGSLLTKEDFDETNNLLPSRGSTIFQSFRIYRNLQQVLVQDIYSSNNINSSRRENYNIRKQASTSISKPLASSNIYTAPLARQITAKKHVNEITVPAISIRSSKGTEENNEDEGNILDEIIDDNDDAIRSYEQRQFDQIDSAFSSSGNPAADIQSNDSFKNWIHVQQLHSTAAWNCKLSRSQSQNIGGEKKL